MTRLDSEFCNRLRQARREAGLTQSGLAREVGCKQSALSMFEQGDGTKLNDDVIGRLAKKFGIEITKTDARSTANRSVVPSVPRAAASGFCPNPKCPTNHSYELEGRVFYRPDRASADPVGGKYCAFCGELLERHCPNCGVPVHEGAICSICGEPYICDFRNGCA